MNNLAYGNQQSEKVGAQVEEKLRKETGATAPVPYQVESGDAAATSAATVLSDVTKGLFGGRPDRLFTLVFDMSTPRAAQLRASADRQGVGCHVSVLLYSAKLSKPVKGEASLDEPKLFGGSKFSGDADTANKLNAKGDLLKRLGKLVRTEAEIGGLTIHGDRLVRVAPSDGGSLVLISTLPRATSMGMDATLDAKEFFDVLGMIEAAL
jgi:hypothetical protein